MSRVHRHDVFIPQDRRGEGSQRLHGQHLHARRHQPHAPTRTSESRKRLDAVCNSNVPPPLRSPVRRQGTAPAPPQRGPRHCHGPCRSAVRLPLRSFSHQCFGIVVSDLPGIRGPAVLPRHTLYVMCVPRNGDGTHITYRARRLALVSPGHTSSPARQSGCGSSALAARSAVAASGVGGVSRFRSGSGSSVGIRAVSRLGRVAHHQSA